MKDKYCVHLDFHTTDEIEGIGSHFDKEEFKAALKTAGLDSITLFAKGHHGNFYYYSPKFHTHPHLEKPLLDLQLEACREVGVSAKIYISAGVDEHLANLHPEWMRTEPNGNPQNLTLPQFHALCFNSPYTDVLVEQTEEVTKRYMPDGLFFDIIAEYPCACQNCLRDMKKKGLDWQDPNDIRKQARDVLHEWTARVTAAARAIKPDVMIFYNGGDFPLGREDRLSICDLLEAESLPTGGWGYDHFPMSMAYIRRQGKNCIGMTGKFHRTWGEFGGYKYKDALLYEGAQCLAFDAGLSVGDQLHPTGKVDAYTYENIGNAVSYLKEREAWRGGEYQAEIAVLGNTHPDLPSGGEVMTRTGICRMLFEAKYLFDLIDHTELSNKYRFVILGDESGELGDAEYKALCDYIKQGGKIIASGLAPTYHGKIAFDLGAELIGPSDKTPSYLMADYPLAVADGTPLVIYQPFYDIRLTGEQLGQQVRPYFQRRPLHFCSHGNTPCNYDDVSPAITCGKDGIYIAAALFADYAKNGSLAPKQLMLPLFERLVGQKTITTNLPSSGKAALYKKGDSYILHLLYANTIKRGDGIEVIEDLATIADIHVSLHLPEKVRTAVLQPEGVELPLHWEGDTLSFTLDKLHCSAIIELK